jgi:flagellar assembly factor FliW
MKIKTKFYGEVEVTKEEMIYFPVGLPGFETEDQFIHLHSEDSVFGCLQSFKNPGTAFIVLSPFEICPDYDLVLEEAKREQLGITKPEEVLLLSIVTIPPDHPEDATVNLQAPLVINTTAKKGLQVILTDVGYPLHCRLWVKKSSQNIVAAK